MTTILLAGASGYLGSSFLKRYWSEANIYPIVRNHLQLIQPYKLNILSFQDLTSSIMGKKGLHLEDSTLVHLIGCSRESYPNAIYEGNVESTAYLLRVCKQMGIRQVVFMSGYGVTDNTTSVYYQSKALAEAMIRGSGLRYVILRGSYIVGSLDELTPKIKKDARDGKKISIPGHGKYRIQPILVDDLLEIFFRITTSKIQHSTTHNILGETVTLKKFITDIAMKINPHAVFQERNLESLIRESTFHRDAEFSLSQLAILVADKIGKPTHNLLGVQIGSYKDIINLICRDVIDD